jgi:hypothetical protein
MNVFSGAVTARALPCAQPHYWETFAIAFLPADARTFDQPTLEANAAVNAVCSLPVLLKSRAGGARLLPVDRSAGGYQRDDVQVADDGVILDGRVTVRHDASR